MLHTSGQREGESAEEQRARLDRENDEYAVEADRLMESDQDV